MTAKESLIYSLGQEAFSKEINPIVQDEKWERTKNTNNKLDKNIYEAIISMQQKNLLALQIQN